MDHADLDCARRSPTLREPTFGGTWCSSGATTSVMPWSHASYAGKTSASNRENREIEAWVLPGSSP